MILQHKNTLSVIQNLDFSSSLTQQSVDQSIDKVATDLSKSSKWVKKSLTSWDETQFHLFLEGLQKFLGAGNTDWLVWCTGSKKSVTSLIDLKSELQTLHSKRVPQGLSRVWIEKQVQEKALNRRLAAALKKEYKRESFEDLLSHANYWLCHWAEIGQFDEWLQTHDSVKPSVLVEWLKQKMRTEVFARGKDALTRQRTGARTQYEISRGEVHDQSIQISPDTPDVVLQPGAKEGEFEQHVVSMPVEVNLDPNYRLDFTRDLIRLSRPRAGDRYVRIFDLMTQDFSLDEIAEKEGVQKHRAAKLTQRVRDDIKQGAITTSVAKKILKEISEEPFSTRDDLKELIGQKDRESWVALTENKAELTEDQITDVLLQPAIKILSYRKMISENRQGCFLMTDDGEFGLNSGELF